jgi:hypothetical protein
MSIQTKLDLLPVERSVAGVSLALASRISTVLKEASGPTLAVCLQTSTFHDSIVSHIHSFFGEKHSKGFNVDDFFTEEVIPCDFDPSVMRVLHTELSDVLADHFGLTLHRFELTGENAYIDIFTYPLKA